MDDDLPTDVLALSQRDDAEAAFELGCWLLRHRPDPQRAYAWFLRAVRRAGDDDMVWRIAVEFSENGARYPGWLGHWRALANLLSYPRVDAPGVAVEPEVFAPRIIDGTAGWGFDASIQIKTADVNQATQALNAAAPRLSMVCADGVEYADDDAMFAAESAANKAGKSILGASYVSSVYEHRDGPALHMDFKDADYPSAVRTMLDIIIDELLRASVTTARLAPGPKDIDSN